MVGCAPTVIKTVIQQLRASPTFKGLEIEQGEEDIEGNYCEYSLSEEDFGVHPRSDISGEELMAGSVMFAGDEDGTTDSNSDMDEVCDVDSLSEKVARFKWQLLANMFKTATDSAYRSVSAGNILFQKIIWYTCGLSLQVSPTIMYFRNRPHQETVSSENEHGPVAD